MNTYTTEGTCAERFEPLRAAFETLLTKDGGRGAALAVCVDGELVVDLYGGKANDGGSPWNERTRAVVFSTGKAVAALCVLKLVDAGQVALDRPIATYWPEFAHAGKKYITLEDVLTHSAGLPYWEGMAEFVRFGDVTAWPDNRDAAERLAAAEPVTKPRHDLAYHALTYGWLLEEIVMRTTGAALPAILADEIAEPLGLRLTFGASDPDVASLTLRALAEDERTAVVEAYAPDRPGGRVIGAAEPNGIFQVCALASADKFLASSQPAINTVADARSLARLYSAIACGGNGGNGPLLSASLLHNATAVHRTGQDVLSGATYAFGWGIANYHRSGHTQYPESAVGHPGLGGSAAFADPDCRLSFAYVPSALELPPESEHGRAARLIGVLYGRNGARAVL